MHLYSAIIVFALLVSCNSSIKESNKILKDTTTKNKDSIILTEYSDYEKNLTKTELSAHRKKVWKAIENNDEQLYREASTWFRFHPYQNDFMFYTILMAYKNNSPSAHHDVLSFYNRGDGLCKKNDTVLFNFILYNLARAKELGDKIGEIEIDGIIITAKTLKSSGYYLNKMPHKN